MAIDVKKFELLKSKAESAKSDVAKAEGAHEALIKTLKEKYDCDTLEEAEELLLEKDRKANLAEEAYNKALEEFEKEWANSFSDD